MNKLAKVLAGFAALAFVVTPTMPVGAVAMPEPSEGVIELVAGTEYDGGTIPANTIVRGNGAVVKGKVVIGGSNVTIDHVKFVGDGSGVAITSSGTINDTTISNNTFTGYTGPTISLNGVLNRLKITDNIDDNHKANNVTIVEKGEAASIVVSGNTFGNTVRIEGYADGLTTGVEVSKNTFDKIPNAAISVVKADGAKINDNKITLNPENASANLAVGEVVNSSIANNTIVGSGNNTAISVATKDYADKYVGKTSNLTIAGNVISLSNIAMFVSGADDVELCNNKISGQYGLLIGNKDSADTGSVIIGKDNVISGDVEAIHVNPGALTNDAEIRISNEANINGGINDDSAVVLYDEPAPEPTPGDDTDTDTPEVTEPVKDEESTDEADVTAPNTGTTIANFALVLTGITVAVLTAVYATRFASAKK